MLSLKDVSHSPTRRRDVVSEPVLTPAGRRGVIHRWTGAPTSMRRGVVAIGQFDGVHVGHRTLVSEVARRAAERGVASGAVTFDRHPLALLASGTEPRELTSPNEKVRLLLEAGLDFVVVLHLEPALLSTDATTFVDDLLVSGLGVGAVVVGSNFRFGHRAAGDVALLTALGVTRQFDVFCPDLACHGDLAVSSTRIRAAIATGDLAAAEAMLGRTLRLDCRIVWKAGPRLLLAVRDDAARPRTGRFSGCLEGPPGSAPLPVAVAFRGGRPVVRPPGGAAHPFAIGDEAALVLGRLIKPSQRGRHRRLATERNSG